MGRRPAWAKGQHRLCVVCSYWYPERDFRMSRQDNKYKCKWCVESLTELQREQQFKGRLR